MKIFLSFLGGVVLAGLATWTTAPAQPPREDDDAPAVRDRDRRPPPDDEDERREPPDDYRPRHEDFRHFRRGPDGPPHRHPIHPLEKVLDADGNDSISAEEIAAAVDAIKKLDKNNDGKLTRDELRPDPPPRGRGPGRYGPPPPPCRERGDRGPGRYERRERRPPPRFDDDERYERPRRERPPADDEREDEEPGRVDG